MGFSKRAASKAAEGNHRPVPRHVEAFIFQLKRFIKRHFLRDTKRRKRRKRNVVIARHRLTYRMVGGWQKRRRYVPRPPIPPAPDLRHDRWLHSAARARRRLAWGLENRGKPYPFDAPHYREGGIGGL